MSILDQISIIRGKNDPGVRFLNSQYLLQKGEIPSLLKLGPSYINDANFWPLLFIQVALSLHCDNPSLASSLLDSLPSPYKDSLEARRLQCRCLEKAGRFNDALEILTDSSLRFPQDISLRIHLLDTAIKARSQKNTLPILNQFIRDFGVIPEILTLYSQIRMLQSRVADSRTIILQNRCWNSIVHNQEKFSTNLYNTYSSLALGDWLEYSPFFNDPVNNPLCLTLRENLCMQAASLELPQYPQILDSVIKEYS